jgi:TldD protein
MRRRDFFLISLALPAAAQNRAAAADDVILNAMRDELKRSLELRIMEGSPPYFIEYALEDTETFSANAVLGALVGSGTNRLRFPRVQVRVGDYTFDNTNYIYSDFFAAGRIGSVRVPLDNDYGVIRRNFWLATDRVYKGAVEAIARKRAALKNITLQENLNDFAKTAPAKVVLPLNRPAFSEQPWIERVKKLSALFAQFPKILSSDVEFDAGRTNSYLVTSEGTESRFPDDLYNVRIRAASQAPDGMSVRDSASFQSRTPGALPTETELERHTLEVARNVTALLGAPMGEDYSGPVLVEGIAAPQLFAQLLGANLTLPRRPVTEPGRTPPMPVSELEGRMGSRVLPEWFDVVDDPTQQSYRGHELLGYYPADIEGVVPAPVNVIEKGAVKAFLLTRQPVRGFEGSNGRARLPERSELSSPHLPTSSSRLAKPLRRPTSKSGCSR